MCCPLAALARAGPRERTLTMGEGPVLGGRALCCEEEPRLAVGRVRGRHWGDDRQVEVGWEPGCHPGTDRVGWLHAVQGRERVKG